MGNFWKPAASLVHINRSLLPWKTEALGQSNVAIDFHRELSLNRLLCTFWHMPDPVLNKHKLLFQDAHFSHFQITFQLILLHAQWTVMLGAIFLFVCFNGEQLQPLRGHNNSRIRRKGIREKRQKGEKEKRRRRWTGRGRKKEREREGGGDRERKRREAFLNALDMASYATVVPVKIKPPGSGIKINNST